MRPGASRPDRSCSRTRIRWAGDCRSWPRCWTGPSTGLFHGIHVLPPFPSSGDRGFAPLTYHEIDPRFGTWDDIRRLGERHDVVLDLMINHISRQSPEFQDFERRGRRSPYADLFITVDKIWPDGDPPRADIDLIFLRKPDSPFSTITIRETGEQERVWTSFGSADWSEQVDLDITSNATRALITDWLASFASQGVRIVRLDAVGYVVKKPGTSCFMVEPEIYEFLAWVTDEAAACGLTVLPEVHDAYATHRRLSEHGMWTYDFVLPGLILHAFETGDARRLAEHLAGMPDRVFTTLDCHDGIPDPPGSRRDPRAAARCSPSPRWSRRRGGNVNRILSSTHAAAWTSTSSTAPTTRRSAATTTGMLPRAPSSSSPGACRRSITWACSRARTTTRPSEQTGEGRAINRHDYTLRRDRRRHSGGPSCSGCSS